MIFADMNAIYTSGCRCRKRSYTIARRSLKRSGPQRVWTRDLAILVQRSNQMSHEATNVENWSFVASNNISTIWTCPKIIIFGLRVIYMVNSRRFTTSVLNCCFEFTQSRKKEAYFSGFQSRNKVIKMDNSAAILFCNKVRCVWRPLTYRGITCFASFFFRTFLGRGVLEDWGALHF